ncbi:hypothetical protein ACOMHN_067185 [Nucella lapillus]
MDRFWLSHYWEGPSQYVQMSVGKTYQVSGWVKVLEAGGGQTVMLEIDFTLADNTHHYETVASRSNQTPQDGWVHISGAFTVPSNLNIKSTRFYFQGPKPGIQFLADDASVTEMGGGSTATGSGSHGNSNSHSTIDQLRKSNINIRVTTAPGVNKNDITIRLVQTKKSFPFGTAVNSWYNANDAGGKYRDFIHKHFNCWRQVQRLHPQTLQLLAASTETSSTNTSTAGGKYRDFIHKHFNCWRQVQRLHPQTLQLLAASTETSSTNTSTGPSPKVPSNGLPLNLTGDDDDDDDDVFYSHQGQKNYDRALNMIHGLKSHG